MERVLRRRRIRTTPSDARQFAEQQLLAKYFPEFQNYSDYPKPNFSGCYSLPGGRYCYRLRLDLPEAYPHAMPELYVAEPKILYKRQKHETVNDENFSHPFHTGSTGVDGCVQICHDDSNSWNASKSLVLVFLKGVIWLQAYENYLNTGEEIAAYIERQIQIIRG